MSGQICYPDEFKVDAVAQVTECDYSVIEVAERLGIITKSLYKRDLSQCKFYKYRSKYGGMEVSDVAKLKEMEYENTRLKRLLADTMLDNAVLKDFPGKKLTTSNEWREAALRAMRDHSISQCRVCRLVGVERSAKA